MAELVIVEITNHDKKRSSGPLPITMQVLKEPSGIAVATIRPLFESLQIPLSYEPHGFGAFPPPAD